MRVGAYSHAVRPPRIREHLLPLPGSHPHRPCGSVPCAEQRKGCPVAKWRPPLLLLAIHMIVYRSGSSRSIGSCTGAYFLAIILIVYRKRHLHDSSRAQKGRCHVPHVLRGGAGGPSTRWWEGWAPQRTPHRVSTICGHGSCAAKRRGWRVVSHVRRTTYSALRDLQDRVHEHRLPRDLRVVYRKGSLHRTARGEQGEVPSPARFSWGGRRALNALVGGWAPQRISPWRAHGKWVRFVRINDARGRAALRGDPGSLETAP